LPHRLRGVTAKAPPDYFWEDVWFGGPKSRLYYVRSDEQQAVIHRAFPDIPLMIVSHEGRSRGVRFPKT